MLLDLASLAWSEEMLNVFGFDASMLPTLVSNAEIYGAVR
jgi:glycerol kinase